MSRISETQNVPADAAARAKRIVRTSFVGIGANVLLSGFKAAVGLAAGSVSVVMDAVNNLTDALGSVLTLAGVQLARRAPDAKHPFGYGRIEYFSAVSIAALVLAAGAKNAENADYFSCPLLHQFYIRR